MTLLYLFLLGKRSDEIGPTRTALAGSFAGAVFWTIFFPFDMIKSRMQISLSRRKSSFLGELFHIIREEGIIKKS